jgi:competence ComEA-like helix-hairpin-helix protein
MTTQFDHSQASTIKIAGSHGYRIEGDMAFLNAEIAVLGEQAHRAQWALQLWACDQAHSGGKLSGFKVAEAPIELPRDKESERQRLQAEAFARFPAERRDYSMVLVLASASREGAFEQVHDFANYPARQPFVTPHLDGAVRYTISESDVSLRADRVCNPRHHDNLSGSLSLDLFALSEPYTGGEVRGEVVATAPLGQLAGQSLLENVDRTVPFSAPPAGQWHMVLVLREWTLAAGFVIRDFCSFAAPYETPAPAVEPAAPAASNDEKLAVLAAPIDEKLGAPAAPIDEKVAAPAASIDEKLAAPAAPIDEKAAIPVAASEENAVEPVVDAVKPRDRRVAIHTATVEELAKVNGLTKKLASEIVRLRPFATLDDLVRVRGIGEKMLRKLRDHLML